MYDYVHGEPKKSLKAQLFQAPMPADVALWPQHALGSCWISVCSTWFEG